MRLEIWEPRWKDKMVLIACYKVGLGRDYEIVFTKSKCLKGKEFPIKGDKIMSYPKGDNGSIPCYVVPLEIIIGQKEFEFASKG